MTKIKWYSLTFYHYANATYLLQMKIRKTGRIVFRTSRLNRLGTDNCSSPIMDINEQWDKFIKENIK